MQTALILLGVFIAACIIAHSVYKQRKADIKLQQDFDTAVSRLLEEWKERYR